MNKLRPDRKAAEAFLKILDPNTDQFTFQTFDDDSDRDDPKLTRVLHGSLDDHWDAIVELNMAGAGIFISLNRTNPKNREGPDITGDSAIRQENDGDV